MPDVLSHEMLFGPQVTLRQLRPILLDLARSSRRGEISVCLWSDPGVGKTELSKQVAREVDIDYRRYNLSTEDYLQLGGFPQLIEGAKGNKRAVRYPILDIPADGEGIFVLDDFTHAPGPVQNLALDLALERKLNDAVMGPGWLLLLCANPEGGVHPMQPAVSNRLMHFWVVPDYESWRAWALKADVRQEIIGYLDSDNMFLYQKPERQEKAFPTPRSWVKLSSTLDIAYSLTDEIEIEDTENELQEDGSVAKVAKKHTETIINRPDLRDADPLKMMSMAASCVGAPAAAAFNAYLRTYGLIDFDKILTQEHPALKDLCVGDHKDANVKAIEFALVARARGWWSTKARASRTSRAKALGNILSYLSPHFRTMLIRDFNFTDGARFTAVQTEVRKVKELKWVEDLFVEVGKVMAGRGLGGP